MKISDSVERKLNCGKMLKSRRRAYLGSALGEMSELEDSYEYPPPKNQRKQTCAPGNRAYWPVGAEDIRRPVPRNERAGVGKDGMGFIVYRTPIRVYKVSGATAV